jgi:hypothetical protein
MNKKVIFLAVSLLALISLAVVFFDDFKIIGSAIYTDRCAFAKDTFYQLSKDYTCTTNDQTMICQKGGDIISYEQNETSEYWTFEGKTFVHDFKNNYCEVK